MDVVEEPADRVPGEPDATAWRRAARAHQDRWREARGLPAGVQRVPKRAGGGTRPIGSRLDLSHARTENSNFLTEAARSAVAHRLDPERSEIHQMIDADRLMCDLLSSMPMCFNLFGPMWADPALAAAVTNRWFPDLAPPDATVTVEFVWSPGRADPRWLDDRTAFDVALQIEVAGGRRLVGIETKYHEFPLAEPLVRRRRAGRSEHREPKPRYLAVAGEAGLFDDPEWISKVWAADLEQVWRDHLLAVACARAGDVEHARSVVVAPAANPPWRGLCERYAAMLTPAARTGFEYRSLDSLVDAAADLLPHAAAFRERYLDVS